MFSGIAVGGPFGLSRRASLHPLQGAHQRIVILAELMSAGEFVKSAIWTTLGPFLDTANGSGGKCFLRPRVGRGRSGSWRTRGGQGSPALI